MIVAIPHEKMFTRHVEAFFSVLDRVLESDLIVIGGGSRGGVRELVWLAKYILAYGFEPNRAECDNSIKN